MPTVCLQASVSSSVPQGLGKSPTSSKLYVIHEENAGGAFQKLPPKSPEECHYSEHTPGLTQPISVEIHLFHSEHHHVSEPPVKLTLPPLCPFTSGNSAVWWRTTGTGIREAAWQVQLATDFQQLSGRAHSYWLLSVKGSGSGVPFRSPSTSGSGTSASGMSPGEAEGWIQHSREATSQGERGHRHGTCAGTQSPKSEGPQAWFDVQLSPS